MIAFTELTSQQTMRLCGRRHCFSFPEVVSHTEICQIKPRTTGKKNDWPEPRKKINGCKKCLGSGVKIRHGQETGTTYIFCFGLMMMMC